MAVLVVAAHDGKTVRSNVANAVTAAAQMGTPVVDADARLLAFAFLARSTAAPDKARPALDRLSAELAS